MEKGKRDDDFQVSTTEWESWRKKEERNVHEWQNTKNSYSKNV